MRLLQRIACALGWHPDGRLGVEKVAGFRWTRHFCTRCGTVLTVRDSYTGANYSGADQIADDHWDIYANPSDAAWLFTLGKHDGEQVPS